MESVAAMPRYRVTGTLPEVLEYRTARFFLKQWEGMYGGWNWSAQKDQQRYAAVIIIRAQTVSELEEMRRTGFHVPANGPEEKVMQRLVRDGVAELITSEHSGESGGESSPRA